MALNQVGLERLGTQVSKKIGASKNIVVNGACLVAQRGTSFTATGNEYTVDRFSHHTGSGFNFDTTTTQSSDAPNGFSKAIKITPDSVVTPSATQNGLFAYSIEGQDVQQLAYGTSSPQKVTLSFYAKSSSQNNNHQYSIQIRKVNTAGNYRHVLQPFTVTSSYQRFTFTFDGDTASDIVDGTGLGLELDFILVAGSSDLESATSTWATSSGFRGVTGQSNFMDNTSNEFYLTGVQLEVGSVATDFEHRSFAEELILCKRYFQQYPEAASDGFAAFGSGSVTTSTQAHFAPTFPTMRAAPTAAVSGNSRFVSGGSSKSVTSIQTFHAAASALFLGVNVASGLTVGHAGIFAADNDSTAKLTFTAEL